MGRIPRSAADALVGTAESVMTRGSGTWASRADPGIRPTQSPHNRARSRQSLPAFERLPGRQIADEPVEKPPALVEFLDASAHIARRYVNMLLIANWQEDSGT